MKSNLKYIIIGLILVISLYFIFSDSDSEKNSEEKPDDTAALSALFGGGDPSAAAKRKGDRSVFDSDFFKNHSNTGESGDDSESGDEPDILDPASENNPVNPATGQRFTDSNMKQFDELRSKFPNNDIIPKRMTPEEKAAADAKKARVEEIRLAMSKSSASKDDVELYYQVQSKPINDRLELINYVIEKQGDNMPADIKEKYEEIRKMNQTQMDNFEKAKAAEMAKAK
jgi:hypothetical protein